MGLSEHVCEILDQVPNGPSDDLESDTVEFKEFGSENALHTSREISPKRSLLYPTGAVGW